MDELRIRAATAADVPAIANIVDQAYRHYIARIGKPPGPMLDDYAARVSEGTVWVLEDGAVIAAIIVLLPMLVFGRWVRRLSRQSQDSIAEIAARGTETLNAVPTVQAFTQENYERRAFGDAVERAFGFARDRTKARAILTAVAIFTTFASLATVLLVGLHDVIAGRTSGGDLVAFMHGIHGSDHHMIAFVKSDGPGLHHLSWDVGSINDIGVGASHMAEKGFAYGWGLGRHVLGSNYFHYVRDPWGSYAEYSCDIDYIPVTQNWRDGDHPPEDSFDLWGPNPPEDFAHNFEVAK